MDVQNLEKNQRNKIIKELCDQGAGFRQLARITGISYGIIQRVVTDQRTPDLLIKDMKKVMQDAKDTSNKYMKLIKIKIRRFKETVTGILLDTGTQWSLIRLNVVDYVLDGFQFTNKKYVTYESEIKECTMQYKILSLKNRKEDMPLPRNLNILDDNYLLYSFLKRYETLLAVCLHREDVLYVGKIIDIGPKSFIFDSYDTELQKSGIMNIEFTKVRYIQMHTDYLDSLCLILSDHGVGSTDHL